MGRLGGLSAAIAALVLVSAAPASAATFTVTGTLDVPGSCIGASCPTLRAAVSKANESPGPDQIMLQPGVFRLERSSKTHEESNVSGDLNTQGELTIKGAGAQATTILAAFPASEPDRVIQATGNANLTVADLTVSGGRNEPENAIPFGGGIDSDGSGILDLERVVVSGNRVKGPAVAGLGAGFYKGDGELVVNDSAVLSNTAPFGGGAGAWIGQSATGTITNTTFAGNVAGRFGGALYSEATIPVKLAFVTVTANEAQEFGGAGIGGDFSLRDSIIVGNTAPVSADCENTEFVPPPIDEGGNVVGPSCGFTQASDVTTTNPLLGALEGSPIPYLEPLAGSPALDRALAPCPATDVRGVARPQGGACDSGAVERVVPVLASISAPTLIAPGGGKPTGAKAPALTSASQSNAVWRAGNKLANIAKRLPVGTVFSFALDQRAGVTLTFTQPALGRRVAGKCVAPRPTNSRKRSCKRTVTRGALTLLGHAGTNKVSFQGRISSARKLKPGSYTVRIAASTAAGRSQTRTLSFTIVK
ncbi:MAG TPA: choice-of-anchor Q domain-containing protein [Solirubrobacteraceae bacterium]|jgi:predicted outer membrane repeat protein|nr:choice-of-anchor Q domain-containing protein [Solirubrobacteraceae bacterium]